MNKICWLIFYCFLLFSATIGVMCTTLEGEGTWDSAATQDLEDHALVSVVHSPGVTDYSDEYEVYDLVKHALEQLNLGDPQNPLSNLIEPGDMVVLKPNLVAAERIAFEGCTRTPVLRPIVDLAAKAGASKVVIAEGPADPNWNDEVFYSADIDDLVYEMQLEHPGVSISYQNINKDSWTWVNLGEYSTFFGVYTAQELYSYREIRMDQNSYYYATDSKGYNPHGYTPGLYAIANTILEADVLINVPKMKVHMITGVTMSLKNLIGITVSDTENMTNQESIKDVPHWNTSYSHRGEDKERIDTFENDVIWRVNSDLHKVALYADKNGDLKPTKQRKYLSVVDGIIGMEGPLIYDATPDPRPTGVIVAGQDPVAVDIVGSRIMGFNYTVLYSLTNMAKVSDHIFGTADPTKICVLGASLTRETFGEPYVPHINYEDDQISPYKIRLQNFDPPESEVIEIHPETPRESVETRVIVYPRNIELVAAGWLHYSLGDAEPMIMKMDFNGETMISNLGLLEGGTKISYSVCLQDFFLNTDWSDQISLFVSSLEVFSVFWNEVEYHVTTISNSTVADFNFSQPESRISFNVTSPSNAPGFCNVTIPVELLDGDFHILIDDEPILDYVLTRNTTHSSLYFTYNHLLHRVEIIGTTVILDTTPPTILVLSPENKTYAKTDVPLTLTADESTSWMAYSLDNKTNVTITGNVTLSDLPEGSHSLVVWANDTVGNMGYSNMIYFTVDTIPPEIQILSPQNSTYATSSVTLGFTVNEPASWIGWSLDAQTNVTIVGDTTLSDLADGLHSIVVYARDTAGNTGASEVVHFSIETPHPKPFPTQIIAVIVIAAAFGAALLIYFVRVRM